MELINESNTGELEKLEKENFNLKQEIQGVLQNNKLLAKERASLVDFKEQMSAKEKQFEKDLKVFTEEINRLNSEYGQELQAKSDEIARLRSLNS